MSKKEILDEIKNTDNLLSLPQVLSEILEEVSKEDFSADSLADIILKDQAMTSRILKMANSSFYSRLTEIKTVHQAVSVLGVTTVKCLALSSSVLHPEQVAVSSGVSPQAFFSYVLSIASASEAIAKAISYSAIEEAFIAGLLNDVGVLYFLHHHPEKYATIVREKKKTSTLVEAEMEVFGIDHCEVGSILAKTWGLPDYVVTSISRHHHIDLLEPDEKLQNIVALSVLIVDDRFSGYKTNLENRMERINKVASLLDLEKEQVDEISSSILASAIQVAAHMDVDIGNIEDMLVKANQEIWKSYITIENLFKERQELSANLLKEEHEKGAAEAKNIAMATLSHYLNNAMMAICGRSQLMMMMINQGRSEELLEKLPADLEIIDVSVQKIVAVLEEMREISPIDEAKYHTMSKAMNLDDCIAKRVKILDADVEWRTKAEEVFT